MNHGHDHADHHHHHEMTTKASMVMNQQATANHGGHASHLHDMMMSVSI